MVFLQNGVLRSAPDVRATETTVSRGHRRRGWPHSGAGHGRGVGAKERPRGTSLLWLRCTSTATGTPSSTWVTPSGLPAIPCGRPPISPLPVSSPPFPPALAHFAQCPVQVLSVWEERQASVMWRGGALPATHFVLMSCPTRAMTARCEGGRLKRCTSAPCRGRRAATSTRWEAGRAVRCGRRAARTPAPTPPCPPCWPWSAPSRAAGPPLKPTLVPHPLLPAPLAAPTRPHPQPRPVPPCPAMPYPHFLCDRGRSCSAGDELCHGDGVISVRRLHNSASASSSPLASHTKGCIRVLA